MGGVIGEIVLALILYYSSTLKLAGGCVGCMYSQLINAAAIYQVNVTKAT